MKKRKIREKDGTIKYKIVTNDKSIKYYDYVSKFHSGFAVVRNGYKWGFINSKGNEICPVKYEFPKDKRLSTFCEGYAVVGGLCGKSVEALGDNCEYLTFGYINTNGEEVCPFIYTAACDFNNKVAWVRDEDMKWFLINNEFKPITKRKYDNFHDFFYGYAIVELNGNFGFINEKGEELCEIKYKYMSTFNEKGLAQIIIPGTKPDRTYWIDTKGNEYYILFGTDTIFPFSP